MYGVPDQLVVKKLLCQDPIQYYFDIDKKNQVFPNEIKRNHVSEPFHYCKSLLLE